MKFRIWNQEIGEFRYYDINFKSVYDNPRHFSSLYHIGTFAGVELYEGDIIKVNDLFYSVRFSFKRGLGPVITFNSLSVKINRNPVIESGFIISTKECSCKDEVDLTHLKLIGNIYNIHDLKL